MEGREAEGSTDGETTLEGPSKRQGISTLAQVASNDTPREPSEEAKENQLMCLGSRNRRDAEGMETDTTTTMDHVEQQGEGAPQSMVNENPGFQENGDGHIQAQQP